MMTEIGVAGALHNPWEPHGRFQVAPDCIIGRLSNHRVKNKGCAPGRGLMFKPETQS